MYYGLFRWGIQRFDLKTPGREEADGADAAAAPASSAGGLAAELVSAFGGAANIRSLDACITRLRIQVVDPARANPDRLKALGAAGVVAVGNNLQAVFGTRSENLKTDMEAYLRAGGGAASAAIPPVPSEAAAAERPAPPDPEAIRSATSIMVALGGPANIASSEARALTRVRVKVVDPALVNEAALAPSGVRGVMRLDGNVLHLIVGAKAGAIASALKAAV
jgi:PTS system glucose-specific IIC component